MGANAIVNAAGLPDAEAAAQTMAALGGYGADVVFECAGAAQTTWNMCEVAAPGGHVAVVGITDDDRVVFNHSRPRRKGVTLRLCRRSLHTLRPCIELAASGALRPEQLVTHVLPAAQVQKGFQMVDASAEGVLKVLVDMGSW
jgi:D-xylulose reductase